MILIPDKAMADFKKINPELPSVKEKSRKPVNFKMPEQILTPRDNPRGFSETPKYYEQYSQSVLP